MLDAEHEKIGLLSLWFKTVLLFMSVGLYIQVKNNLIHSFCCIRPPKALQCHMVLWSYQDAVSQKPGPNTSGSTVFD